MPLVARLLALAGAVLMPVSLFLHWYEVKEGATGDNAKFTIKGWDVFESTDALMVLASIAAVGLIVTVPSYAGRILMLIGAFVTGYIVVQLVDRPGILSFVDRSDLSLEIGAPLGLLGAILILAAGAVASRSHHGGPAVAGRYTSTGG
jgi:hypothetical protein